MYLLESWGINLAKLCKTQVPNAQNNKTLSASYIYIYHRLISSHKTTQRCHFSGSKGRQRKSFAKSKLNSLKFWMTLWWRIMLMLAKSWWTWHFYQFHLAFTLPPIRLSDCKNMQKQSQRYCFLQALLYHVAPKHHQTRWSRKVVLNWAIEKKTCLVGLYRGLLGIY